MSENNNENIRTTIENEINGSLMDDLSKKNALDFIAYLRANGMTTTDANYPGVFRYLGEAVCVLAIHPIEEGELPVYNIYWGDYDSTIFSSDYDDFPMDEQLKEFAWKHIHLCVNFTSNGKYCGCGSQPGKSMKILGKEFDNLCTSIIWFGNPDAATLETIYKLAEVWKLCIVENAKKS